MERTLDLDLIREYSERQRADAERQIMLADALGDALRENRELRARLEKAAAPAAPEKGK